MSQTQSGPGGDFDRAALHKQFPFVPGRPDINEGIELLEQDGFALTTADFNPRTVSKINFTEPGTTRVATILYSDRGAPVTEPYVLIGASNTTDPETVITLAAFVAQKRGGGAANPQTRPAEGFNI